MHSDHTDSFTDPWRNHVTVFSTYAQQQFCSYCSRQLPYENSVGRTRTILYKQIKVLVQSIDLCFCAVRAAKAVPKYTLVQLPPPYLRSVS
jgi:hypothetical protein